MNFIHLMALWCCVAAAGEQVSAGNLYEELSQQTNTGVFKKLVDLATTSTTGDSFKTILSDASGSTLYTLLAPTDNAVSKYFPSALDDYLLTAADSADALATLNVILKYHLLPNVELSAVVINNLLAQQPTGFTEKTMLQEVPLVFQQRANVAFINNARLAGGQVQASNGMLLTIDRVLVPPNLITPPGTPISIGDILDGYTAALSGSPTAVTDPPVTTMFEYFQSIALSSEEVFNFTRGPFTVLAPTDAAFSALDPKVVQILRSDATARRYLLAYHCIVGAYLTSASIFQYSAADGSNPRTVSLTTLSPGGDAGTTLGMSVQYSTDSTNKIVKMTVTTRDKQTGIPNTTSNIILDGVSDDQRNTSINIIAANGIVHAVDAVIISPDLRVYLNKVISSGADNNSPSNLESGTIPSLTQTETIAVIVMSVLIVFGVIVFVAQYKYLRRSRRQPLQYRFEMLQ